MGYEMAMENLHLLSFEDNASLVACPSRDFNTTQYESTIVIEVGNYPSGSFMN